MGKENMISNNQLIFSVDELKGKGFSYYKITQLVENGNLKKLNKKNYVNTNFSGEELDYYYAYAFAPIGVVCLLSAAVYYNLTTYKPEAIDVAIPRKSKISTLPEWPQLKIFYFTDDRYKTGIQTIVDENNLFRIYDIEKTVVDIVYYREKVGIDETKEILKNYLNRKDRNINKLVRYAKVLKCDSIIQKYLEVLV